MRRSGGPGDGLEVTRKLLRIIPTLFLKANWITGARQEDTQSEKILSVRSKASFVHFKSRQALNTSGLPIAMAERMLLRV